MSQGQPTRPSEQADPIKYGDVFNVSGELADKPIAPQDASTMQSAETRVLGHAQKGGVAAVMQSAADVNESRGAVGHYDATSAAKDQGVAIYDTEVAGHRVVTEAVGGQVVGQYVRTNVAPSPSAANVGGDAVTIGEALEATALMAGDKPVDQSDAAAIQAAEVRATGLGEVTRGGIGATAQSAATQNLGTMRDKDKTKLGDVLRDATLLLPKDKPATREDAEGVIGAEMRNKPDMGTHPGGVAASVAAAARLNQDNK